MLMGKPRGTRLRVMLLSSIAKLVFVPQMGKAGEQLAQRIQQDLADGTAFISPPIEVDKDQVASLATQTLTHEHYNSTPLPSPPRGRSQIHRATSSLPIWEGLGIGQTDTPIIRHKLGEVSPILSESVLSYELKFSLIQARTSPSVPILSPDLSATFGSSRKCLRLCVAR